jgi:hypothetical protein
MGHEEKKTADKRRCTLMNKGTRKKHTGESIQGGFSTDHPCLSAFIRGSNHKPRKSSPAWVTGSRRL